MVLFENKDTKKTRVQTNAQTQDVSACICVSKNMPMLPNTDALFQQRTDDNYV